MGPSKSRAERVTNEADQPKLEMARIPYADGFRDTSYCVYGRPTVYTLHAQHNARPVPGKRFSPTRGHDACHLLGNMKDVKSRV